MFRKIIIIIALALQTIAAIISCSSDDPAEQIVFTPGEYRGTYAVNANYGIDPYASPEVDTMKFFFTAGTPNTMAIRLDPYDTQDRDFCDWNCIWTLDRDSLKVENCEVYNSICVNEEHPCVTYYHYVDNSKREFIFIKPDVAGNMWRKITLWVP